MGAGWRCSEPADGWLGPQKEGTHMTWALFETEVFIRFAEEPAAFVCTVKYGSFTIRSERVSTSGLASQTAAVNERHLDESDAVKQLLRKRNFK
jgi:hypothetical protein